EHLGDLEDAPGLDLLRVLPVAPVPGLLVDLDLLVPQDAVDLSNHVLANDAAQANGVDVLGGNHDRHVAVEDPQHVELTLGARNHACLDALDHPDAMRRVHDLFPHFEHAGHFELASRRRADEPPHTIRRPLDWSTNRGDYSDRTGTESIRRAPQNAPATP